jgi:CxxC motif-containing protein (DUF1111 family)
MAPALDAVAAIGQVAEASIIARADPDDADGDGISGRVHMLRRARRHEIVGRFNWKATEASARSQIATAFRFDMGLSTSLQAVPAGDCMPSQADCLDAGRQGSDKQNRTSVMPSSMRWTALCNRLARRSTQSRLPASDQFMSAGCGKCHVPQMDTGLAAGVVLYSDLVVARHGARTCIRWRRRETPPRVSGAPHHWWGSGGTYRGTAICTMGARPILMKPFAGMAAKQLQIARCLSGNGGG